MNNKPRLFIGLGFGVIVVFLSALAGWIGFEVAQFQTSFWFGFGLIGDLAIIGLGLFGTIQLASHGSTVWWKVGAYAVGAFTVLVAVGLVLVLVIIQFALKGAVFNGNNMGLGVISALIVAACIASIPVYGMIAAKLTK
jgi:hypothetical protein